MPVPATALPHHPHILRLRPGELVRVRSASEIFRTLDDRGRLEGLPFMPEMVQFCGQIFPVFKRADKTCDGFFETRRMENAVHLANVRCDGKAHGGCQAACLTYWKEAWLERVQPDAEPAMDHRPGDEAEFLRDVLVPTTTHAPSDGHERRYRCQATELPNAAERLPARQVGQYVRDARNWGPWKVLRGLLVHFFNQFQRLNRKLPGVTLGSGRSYPFVAGEHEKGQTPSGRLDLKPGDLVRIKSKDEILRTLDKSHRNRGLSFDVEMVKYCGRIARVRGRVERLVDEQTGKMVEIKSDCIVLEGVVCTADYHRLCTRSAFPYWREIWLERIG